MVRDQARPSVFDTCKNIYRFPAKHSGNVGVEIETETKRRYDVPEFTFWNSTGDGSLRDYGIEYVMKQPVKVEGPNDELHLAMAEFEEKTKGLKFIKDSISTSVHVHLNVLNEDFLTIANFFTAYALTENILIRYSGPDRLSNLFCLPMCDAEATVEYCLQFIKAIKTHKYNALLFENNRVKYSALNLAAFSRFGSLEIRSFRGETDAKVIETWVRILHSILKYAQKDQSPKDIMERWRERKVKILDDIYGEYSRDLIKAIPEKEDANNLLIRNGWYAARMATAVKDWNSYAVPKVKKVTRGKYLDQLNHYSQIHYNKNYDDLNELERFVVDEMYLRDVNAPVIFPDDDGNIQPEPFPIHPPEEAEDQPRGGLGEMPRFNPLLDAVNRFNADADRAVWQRVAGENRINRVGEVGENDA